ncbi:sensor histidine kinase [Salinarimonas soli]|nr:histidine kinase dimerization/phosphoacceptor domain -containing protein [Salinarimonas soli]
MAAGATSGVRWLDQTPPGTSERAASFPPRTWSNIAPCLACPVQIGRRCRYVNMEACRILVVDDDPDVRTLVRRTLGQEFPCAEIKEAGDEAALAVTLAGWHPDILVTDFDLRWSDGIRIFDRVKAGSPECCTVMFTGTGNEEIAVQAMKHGFDDYVVKRSNQLKRLAASARIALERTRERRNLAESRDLVLKELYHRLHNNLQIVISLLRMTEKAMPDAAARGQLADLARRIQALTALQEEFYRSEDFRRVDFGAYLERLTEGLIGAAGDRLRVVTHVASTILPVDVAVPLGLIANELMTNILKHAFPGDRPGEVLIRLDQEDDAIVLSVQDNGVGRQPPSGETGGGLGTSLMRRLASQIDAEVRVDHADTGTTCRVSLPR